MSGLDHTTRAIGSDQKNAELALPLQSGLSQHKWVRFGAGGALLTDYFCE